MPIQVKCPDCATSYKVPDTSAGKRLKCKTCQAEIEVPDQIVIPEAVIRPRRKSAQRVRTDLVVLRVNAVRLDWPDMCPCCEGAANAEKEIFATKGDGKVIEHARSWLVPYCAECARHSETWEAHQTERRQTKNTLVILVGFGAILCIPFGMILGFAIDNLFVGVLATILWLAGFGVPAVMYWSKRKHYLDDAPSRRGDECYCEGPAVRYLNWRESEHVFGFESETYADTFFEMNRDKIVK